MGRFKCKIGVKWGQSAALPKEKKKNREKNGFFPGNSSAGWLQNFGIRGGFGVLLVFFFSLLELGNGIQHAAQKPPGFSRFSPIFQRFSSFFFSPFSPSVESSELQRTQKPACFSQFFPKGKKKKNPRKSKTTPGISPSTQPGLGITEFFPPLKKIPFSRDKPTGTAPNSLDLFRIFFVFSPPKAGRKKGGIGIFSSSGSGPRIPHIPGFFSKRIPRNSPPPGHGRIPKLLEV